MPIGGMGHGGMENLKTAFDKRGRSLEGVAVALFGAPTDIDQLTGRIDQGFTDLIFSLPQTSKDKVLDRLDLITKVVEKIR